MENKEKLRVLLQHWIEHNNGHSEEFNKWLEIMKTEGHREITESLEAAIDQMNGVSKTLMETLALAGGKKEGGHHHHHHHHHH
ncbi:MAG: hypothetical protein D6B25_18560 [Desulfobulbaceae bacterium]|nr:MAG: hypothetical protein D6B25_18560 [Desulfobulbaceae bacterium]